MNKHEKKNKKAFSKLGVFDSFPFGLSLFRGCHSKSLFSISPSSLNLPLWLNARSVIVYKGCARLFTGSALHWLQWEGQRNYPTRERYFSPAHCSKKQKQKQKKPVNNKVGCFSCPYKTVKLCLTSEKMITYFAQSHESFYFETCFSRVQAYMHIQSGSRGYKQIHLSTVKDHFPQFCVKWWLSSHDKRHWSTNTRVTLFCAHSQRCVWYGSLLRQAKWLPIVRTKPLCSVWSR